MPLELNADITTIKGADYNPRKITDEDLAALRESVARLGVVKPIIVRNETIVAGHQRTKALRRLGIERAPVYWLSKDTTEYDEVRFNQLHNGTDLDFHDENAVFPAFDGPGHYQVSPDLLKANFRGKGVMVRAAIAELVRTYGPWGACVAAPSGEIIHAAQYALAVAALGERIDVFVLPEEQVEFGKQALNRQYGVFTYDAIKRESYVQSLAQPKRMVGDSAVTQSRLYLFRVIPHLEENPQWRVLDLGSGQGAYPRDLRKKGFHVYDIEFFRRIGFQNNINKPAVHRMIDRVEKDFQEHGPYDATVCEAVINSVDCVEARDAVMGCLNLFTKMGGNVYMTGRSMEGLDDDMARTSSMGKATRRPEFLDENNFSALWREGQWFFQHYLYTADAQKMVEDWGFEVTDIWQELGYWLLVGRKVREVDDELKRKAVEYEFNMPWPGGQRVGRSESMLRAVGL